MKLIAINADITKMDVDVIVNPANNALAIGGGLSGIIHAAAGTDLIEYIQEHYPLGCQTGCVTVTPGFNLPATYILHTVGPDMREYTKEMGDLLLTACYGNCMKTALNEGLKSIAFPAISTGIFGFDIERAAKIAVDTLIDNFADSDIEVTFACFSDEDTAIVQAAIDYRDEQDYYLSWSVGNTHYPEGPNGEYLEDVEQVLDLDANDSDDGVYKVFHDHLGSVGWGDGVTVKDGKFVIEPTLRACAEARNKAGYWGTFLEGLDWNTNEQAFKARFGS